MSAKSPPAGGPSDDAIRQRAYYLWEADGRPDGRSEHYWQLAMAEAHAAPAAKTKPKVAKAGKEAAAEKPRKVARKAEDKPAKKATKPRAAVTKSK